MDIRIASDLEERLIWLVERLDAWLDRDRYEMGGGTVPAARWQHRLSTDIDLFIDSRRIEPQMIERIIEGVHGLADHGEVNQLEVHAGQGFSCQRDGTPISFFITQAVTARRVSQERVVGAGLATETSAEILLKKMRARMIRSPRYLPRDIYDLIVAHVEDPEGVRESFAQLTIEEQRILSFDAHRGAFRITDFERVIQPNYSALTDSPENLNRFARLVLAQEMNREALEELRGMRRNKA